LSLMMGIWEVKRGEGVKERKNGKSEGKAWVCGNKVVWQVSTQAKISQGGQVRLMGFPLNRRY